MTDPNEYSITSVATDAEAGTEGLDKVSEAKRELKALKVMKDRGLISESEYQMRYEELSMIVQDHKDT